MEHGAEEGREGNICILRADSCCGMEEMNTML
jgi:hypothetical protein